MDDPAPDITAAIVSYNTRDLLRACLASLAQCEAEDEVRLEIVVADNGSDDGSPDMVRAEFPFVRLIETGGNIGYGPANNLALHRACGRYVFILNSDTEIEPGVLRAMCDFLETHPDCGVVGPRLILPDGATQPSCFANPTLASVLWEQTYLHQLLPGNKITGGFEMTYWDYCVERRVAAVCGAAMLVRRELFESVGGFDSHYFMYFEDIDLCLRIGATGAQVWFLPEARVRHMLGASSQSDWHRRARMVAAYNQSRYYFFSQQSAWRGKALKSLVLFGAGLRLAVWSVLSLARPSARDQARLFRDVWRRTWRMTPDGASQGKRA